MKLYSQDTSRQHPAPSCLIYSPYFRGIGGGERYMLTVAECLLSKEWQVDILWHNKEKLLNIADKLEINLSEARVLGLSAQDMSIWTRLKLTRSYNSIFWLSNGSIPAVFGKNNIIHFQRPFKNVGGSKISNQIKLGFVNTIVCNSKFTKKYIDKEFGVNSQVLYPPVDVEQFSQGMKENIILAVGRFERTKKHEVLIKVFKKLTDQGLKDWQLVIIGGSLEDSGDNEYLKKLKEQAKDLPIKFVVNASFSVLKNYYAKSKLFWHAKGYRVSPERPEEMEHFGISPVEAMAAGCVPLVVDKGGLREIVRRGEGERWKTLKELKVKSEKLIADKDKYKKYQKKAVQRSQDFSKQKFCQTLEGLLK